MGNKRKAEDREKQSDTCEQMRDGNPTAPLEEHHSRYNIQLDDVYYSSHREDLESVLQDLNERLFAAGIALSADEHTKLSIDINEDKFYSVTVRKAGRKKKKTNVLMEEVLAYRETHTAMETAEWLGLTRQTFYRKMKQHKDASHGNDVEF